MPASSVSLRTVPAQDPMGARKTGYVIAILCFSLVLIWLIQNPFSATAMQLVFAGTLIVGLIRWSAAILLVLIQLDVYLTTFGSEDSTEPPGLILAFCCVVLLMLLSRLNSAQELTGVRSVTQLLRGAANAWTQSAEGPAGTQNETTDPSVGPELVGIASRALLLVIGTVLLLFLFPVKQSSVREFGMTPSGMRTVSIGLVLFTVYLVLTLPFSEIRWKRLTPDQAGLYLHSRLICWLHRDLRSVERHRRRLHRNRARGDQNSGQDTDGQASAEAD